MKFVRRLLPISYREVGARLAWCVLAAATPLPVLAESLASAHGWIRPAVGADSPPLWGHVEGLRVGLAPLPGPRGLLRIYAPYLDHAEGRVINFMAVEPIPKGETARGLSELEYSQLDQKPGKRFWSRNDLDDVSPQPPGPPATGWLETIDGLQYQRVYVLVEPFDNGAHVYLRLTFREDKPHEVGVAPFVHPDSVPLEQCIVTATMGNFARLRRLHLADRVVHARHLWPSYQGDGFTPHARFPLEGLTRTDDGAALAVATSDEDDPSSADYAEGTRSGWRYVGKPARQTWRHENPSPEVAVLVNGRATYWASRSPIPGGVAFENFEMVAPFRNGDEYWFGVEPINDDN